MKYGAEIIKEIAGFIAQGMGRMDSADAAGINFDTFCQWMKKAEFSESIKKAEFICKQRNIVRIQNASKKSWYAAAWWLERKFPEEFGLKSKQEHTFRGGLRVTAVKQIDLSRLDDNTLKRLARRVEKADGEE